MDEIDVIEYKNFLSGMMNLAVFHADAVRAYYSALVKSGFTRVEALRIVEKHGFQPPLDSGRSDN